jgi:hypothetical protein
MSFLKKLIQLKYWVMKMVSGNHHMLRIGVSNIQAQLLTLIVGLPDSERTNAQV